MKISKFITLPLLVSTAFLGFFQFSFSTEVKAQSALYGQINSIQGRINEINASLEDVSQLKDSYSEEVARVEAEIKETDSLILETNTAIEGLTVEIENNSKNIIKLTEDIQTLTKQIQRNRQISPLQDIISSRDLSEAIGKAFALTSTQNSLNEKREEFEAAKEKSEADLAKQKELKEQLEATKILLDTKKNGLQQLITEYGNKQSEYTQQVAQLKSEADTINNQIEALEQAKKKAQQEAANKPKTGGGSSGGNSGGGGSGGGGVPPSGGCKYEYGGSFNVAKTEFTNPVPNLNSIGGFSCSHEAVDLLAQSGSPILASATGTVIKVSQSCPGTGSLGYMCGGGLGNFVVIYHSIGGVGFTTIYGHMNSVSTSVGASVQKGQRIGSVGSSGNSSAPHLHFHIIPDAGLVNNNIGCGPSKCVNPRRYIDF